jgi:hypothetical protein
MSNLTLIKKLRWAVLVELSLVLVLSLGIWTVRAQSADEELVADQSADAIGIKVLPNPDHNSPYAWYMRNAPNQATPSTLIVDGYEAVRDGRTVYVSAANISPSDAVDNGKLYTNIYAISYNQEPDLGTTDIFGQLLNFWKFNVTLVERSGNGVCLPETLTSCTDNSSCAAGAVCDEGQCKRYCLLSSDCLANQYCDSAKAKLVRDVKRMADLHEINLALQKYQREKKTYPVLAAGTYLPGRSVSVWPSWKEALSKELAIKVPVDPVNRLGACPGYDPVTCWNEQNKRFAADFAASDVLPAGSLAYAYQWLKSEKAMQLCTVYETNYEGLVEDNRCGVVKLSEDDKVPQIVFKEALSQTEGPFTGYFRINAFYDVKNEGIVIEPVSPSDWSDWQGWNFGSRGALTQSATSDPKVKKISAPLVDLPADQPYAEFSFRVTVRDVKGNSNSSISKIKICNPRTCADNACGQMQDNCGGTLVCGACDDGQSCDQINNVCRDKGDSGESPSQ